MEAITTHDEFSQALDDIMALNAEMSGLNVKTERPRILALLEKRNEITRQIALFKERLKKNK